MEGEAAYRPEPVEPQWGLVAERDKAALLGMVLSRLGSKELADLGFAPGRLPRLVEDAVDKELAVLAEYTPDDLRCQIGGDQEGTKVVKPWSLLLTERARSAVAAVIAYRYDRFITDWVHRNYPSRDAEEVRQKLFVRLLKTGWDEPVGNWKAVLVYTLRRWVIPDAAREDARRPQGPSLDQILEEFGELFPDESIEDEEVVSIRESLREPLIRLSRENPQDAVLISLMYYHNLSGSNLAARFGVTGDRMKQMLRTARDRLRRILTEGGRNKDDYLGQG